MTAVGDIVEVKQRPGERWVVAGPASTPLPPGHRWRCIAYGGRAGRQQRVVGAGDLTPLLADITFEPGQQLAYDAETVAVIEDKGDLVRVLIPARRRALPHSPWRLDSFFLAVPEAEADVPKAELVLRNSTNLLKDTNDET